MITSISNSELTALINHSGAELCSLKNNENKEYIWEGNPVYWGKHSPILFPIVGTLKNDSYYYNGNKYNMSRHGFARDMVFSVLQKTENSITFSLLPTAETRETYPFEFELKIIYTLEKNNLNIEYVVSNNGQVQMPFSIGGHPAFSLAEDFENYTIEFEKDENLEYFLLEKDLISNQSKKLEITNKKLDLNYQIFENDALVFKSLQSRSVTILEKSKPLLKVKFEDFPNLGIWTKNKAPFICIEPWLGYADTVDSSGNILEKEGIQLLNSKKIFKSNFNIEIL